MYIYSFIYMERVHQIPHMFPRVSGVLVRLIQLCVQAGGAEPMLREPILEILWWRPSNRWFVALKLPDLSCLTVIVTCQLAAYQEISGLSLTTRPVDFGFANRLLSWSSTRIGGSIVRTVSSLRSYYSYRRLSGCSFLGLTFAMKHGWQSMTCFTTAYRHCS